MVLLEVCSWSRRRGVEEEIERRNSTSFPVVLSALEVFLHVLEVVTEK